jgi:hypothetical protein
MTANPEQPGHRMADGSSTSKAGKELWDLHAVPSDGG